MGTGVSVLADGPLLQTDQVEEMTAGRDDDLRVLQVQVADTADVAVFGQLGLGGRGQGGVKSSDTVTPGEVEGNMPTDEIAGIHHVEEE